MKIQASPTSLELGEANMARAYIGMVGQGKIKVFEGIRGHFYITVGNKNYAKIKYVEFDGSPCHFGIQILIIHVHFVAGLGTIVRWNFGHREHVIFL